MVNYSKLAYIMHMHHRVRIQKLQYKSPTLYCVTSKASLIGQTVKANQQPMEHYASKVNGFTVINQWKSVALRWSFQGHPISEVISLYEYIILYLIITICQKWITSELQRYENLSPLISSPDFTSGRAIVVAPCVTVGVGLLRLKFWLKFLFKSQ